MDSEVLEGTKFKWFKKCILLNIEASKPDGGVTLWKLVEWIILFKIMYSKQFLQPMTLGLEESLWELLNSDQTNFTTAMLIAYTHG